ncbi:MAG: metallophosphoesterase [Actinomycetota bacterium]|nr:metallophosphoesterase [Actinomycetota bacterium]
MASGVLRNRLRSAIRVAELGVGAALASARSRLVNVRGEVQPPPREPYVQSVSASSAVIAWVSEEPGVGLVEYGETPQLGRKGVDAQVGRRHAVALSDLSPASTYYYLVTEADGVSEMARFHTAPEGKDSRFAFAVIGDSGRGRKSQLAVAALLERLKPDLILHTGDVVYPSGEERHYDRRFFVPYGRLLKEVPIFPVLGNHDLERGNGAAYLDNFHLPRNDPRATGRYYSFDWGNAHFVALNSELYHGDSSDSPEEQKAWLERDLRETRQSWKIVYFHRPIYSSSKHGSDERIREDLEPVLISQEVDLVFSGHDHVYERTRSICGVTYVLSGGGGKGLYPAGRSEWTAFSKSTHHAVLIHIGGEHLSLEAVEPDGTVIDRADLRRA